MRGAKILYLLPLTGIDEEERKRREKLANSFVTHEKNKVIVEAIDDGPVSLESTVEEYMSVPSILRKLVAVQDKYDAAIIGCAMDAGLAPARELLEIPVVGPLEASVGVTLTLGESFSIITALDSIVPAIWRTLNTYAMHHKCTSVRVINFSVLDIIECNEEVVEAFLREAKRVVENEKASTVILGCMAMAFLLLDEIVKDKIDIPIVNPAKISIKVAEILLSLNLMQSRVSYPRPKNYENLKISLLSSIDTLHG